MNNNQPSAYLPPSEVFSEQELQSLTDAIINSGELGRSKIYDKLLGYLMDAAHSGKSPKEIEIAIDVLGRNSDFDVSKDAVVQPVRHCLRYP